MGREMLVSGYLWLGCGMCSWPSLVWLIPWVFLFLGFDLLLTDLSRWTRDEGLNLLVCGADGGMRERGPAALHHR